MTTPLFLVASATLAWHQANHGDLDAALRTVAEARGRMDGFADPRSEAYMGMMHTDALLRHRRPLRRSWLRQLLRSLLGGRGTWTSTSSRSPARTWSTPSSRPVGCARPQRSWPGSPHPTATTTGRSRGCAGQIAIAQGKPDEGIATFRRLEIAGTTEENLVNRAHWIAVAQLWLRQPEEAWSGLLPAIEGIVDTVTVRDAGLSFALLARAAADLADERRDRAEALRSTLVELRRGAAVDPLCPAPAPSPGQPPKRNGRRSSTASTCVTRSSSGWPQPRAWDTSLAPTTRRTAGGGQHWWPCGRPGHLATRLLQRASTDARQHVPLSKAIEATARHR